jgi:hypothetical protein
MASLIRIALGAVLLISALVVRNKAAAADAASGGTALVKVLGFETTPAVVHGIVIFAIVVAVFFLVAGVVGLMKRAKG